MPGEVIDKYGQVPTYRQLAAILRAGIEDRALPARLADPVDPRTVPGARAGGRDGHASDRSAEGRGPGDRGAGWDTFAAGRRRDPEWESGELPALAGTLRVKAPSA